MLVHFWPVCAVIHGNEWKIFFQFFFTEEPKEKLEIKCQRGKIASFEYIIDNILFNEGVRHRHLDH